MVDNEMNHNRPTVVRGHRVSGEAAVSGVVHVIRNEAELDKFREGEILVAAEIPEHWGHLFALAKAIITETDEVAGHVIDASRAFDLALIKGVDGVTEDLRSGDLIVMHIDGSVEQLHDRRAPDSEMRVSVPAAVHARQFAAGVDHVAGQDASVVVLPVAKETDDVEQNQGEQQHDDRPRKMC